MTVQKLGAINPSISNISWYKRTVPQFAVQSNTNEYAVEGNPNKPVTYNFDKNAGACKGLNVYYLA